MNKGEIINGYKILEDFKVVGGNSKISFAERYGKEFFIKEFLYPKYPLPDSPGSKKVKEQKRKACDTFEAHHKKLNDLIKSKTSGLGGNLIYTLDFFREGTTYYKVNEKIDDRGLTVKEISLLPLKKIYITAISVCHSIRILHDLNIVHGDLKPENILIKETSRGNYTGKLIDFDDSYFSEEPPIDKEQIVGTPEYYSPELASYLMDEDEELSGKTLTLSSDIFTLGIILTEYFTGEKPVTHDSLPIWKAVQDGDKLGFSKSISSNLKDLILSMLSLKVENRPSIKIVHQILRELKDGRTSKIDKDKESSKSAKRVKLRGALITGRKETDKNLKEPTSKLRGKGLNIKG